LRENHASGQNWQGRLSLNRSEILTASQVLNKHGRPEADDPTMIPAGDIHLLLLPGPVWVGLTAAFLLFALMPLFGGHLRKRTANFDVLLNRVSALRQQQVFETQHAKRSTITVRAKLLAAARERIKREREFLRQRK
jgi:hypothetical protein